MITNSQRVQLTEAYSKSQMERALWPAVKKFYAEKGYKVQEMLPTSDLLKTAFDKVANKKGLNKAELAALCLGVFENKTIYQAFVKTLPGYIQILFEKLLWQKALTAKDAEAITGATLLEEQKYGFSYIEHRLKNELYIFGVNELNFWSGEVRKSYLLYLPGILKEILAEYYPKPLFYNFIPIDHTPDGQYFFYGEKQILMDMPAVLSYHLQAAIKYTNYGKPNESTINKMQRVCNVAEFYHNDDLKNLRTQFLAGMLHHFKITDISADTTELLKNIFEEHYKHIFTPQIILTHLKGWGYINPSYNEDKSFPLLLEVFKKMPVDKWISIENLHEYINTRSIDVKGVESYAINNYLYFDAPSKYGNYTDKTQASVNAERLVRVPFINGAVFLLAAFGLFDVCYQDVNTKAINNTYFSPYEGLLYYRLTPLGAYILGLSKTYTAEIATPKNKLHLSEDSLMILGEGDINVLDVMLAHFTEKEGNGRYRVTSAAFFKDCKNRASIDAKIALFKKTISAKLPHYWEAAFGEWKANAKKVKENMHMAVFNIPHDAKDLQSLLAKDTILKLVIHKAEGFHILVARDNEAKFRHRMKELGYFID